MSRAYFTINRATDREAACRLLAKVPFGTRVEFKAAKRSIPQNERLWAMLSDVSAQLVWYGKKLTTNQWKFLFLDALEKEAETVPSIDGTGLVNIGRASSDLSKQEFGNLLDIIAAFGAEHGVVFNDPAEAA